MKSEVTGSLWLGTEYCGCAGALVHIEECGAVADITVPPDLAERSYETGLPLLFVSDDPADKVSVGFRHIGKPGMYVGAEKIPQPSNGDVPETFFVEVSG